MRYQRWDEQASLKDTNEIVFTLASWHHSELSECYVRDVIGGLIANRDITALCHLELDYSQLTPAQAYHCRQILAFFQKRADIDIGYDRRGVAIEKFKDAEELCSRTNDIFRLWASGKFSFCQDVERVLHRAQRKISRILGDVPSLSDLKIRFGPGATTQVTKRMASVRRKLNQKFSCSEDFLFAAKSSLEEMPGWIPFGETDSTLVDLVIHESRLDFVPKTAKTDRAIAVEPMLNSMFQLGIGSYMADRLRRFGVDIRDQTRNQTLACQGSITGALATLDLSSASDTVATELVFHLLPVDWANLLSTYRSAKCVTEWGTLKLQKFSSMGNGFTFPLETLIFYALSVSCVEIGEEKDVSVYGDDIIVPVGAYDLLSRVLTATGFLLNPSKSFCSGPFRESCGKDYLSGIDIRPCYIKDSLACSDLFVLHNYYIRRGLQAPAEYLLKFLEPELQLWGPDGYGDGHLIGDWQPRPHKRNAGWSGYTFDTFSYKSRKDFSSFSSDYVLPSYTVYVNPAQPGLSDDSPIDPKFERINANFGRRAAFHNVARPSKVDRPLGFGVVLPGTKGYKRMSVYVLSK